MNVGTYCNREVVFIHREATIVQAAQLMRAHHVGDLVVVEENQGIRAPVGIVTDRDIVIEVIAEGVELESVSVGDIMSYRLLKANDDDELIEAIKTMRTFGVRRLPVVNDQNALIGILTVDELLELFSEQIADLATLVMRERKREQEKRA